MQDLDDLSVQKATCERERAIQTVAFGDNQCICRVCKFLIGLSLLLRKFIFLLLLLNRRC